MLDCILKEENQFLAREFMTVLPVNKPSYCTRKIVPHLYWESDGKSNQHAVIIARTIVSPATTETFLLCCKNVITFYLIFLSDA